MSIAGRDTQYTELKDLLSASRRRQGSMALLSGPAAVGKTTLLHDFAQRSAASGALVLRAACSREERNNAWGVVHQLLRQTPRFDDPVLTVVS
ncbi:ATP-binding protein [Streptomyces sp. NPDC005336]|uniref:ATP-binding protein n=1 Tax=Streptomyces sp. NPDC005336 TaxID=3157035 RepID=UPI0033BC7812